MTLLTNANSSPAAGMFDFSGKAVLMTGAARGIGRITALLFAELGADIALVDRNEEGLRHVADEVTAHGVRTVIAPTDVRDAACEAAVAAAGDAFGRLDVLVNCAGGSRNKPFLRRPPPLISTR